MSRPLQTTTRLSITVLPFWKQLESRQRFSLLFFFALVLVVLPLSVWSSLHEVRTKSDASVLTPPITSPVTPPITLPIALPIIDFDSDRDIDIVDYKGWLQQYNYLEQPLNYVNTIVMMYGTDY